MIVGIGTDLLDAERIRDGLARFGEHYADRILAPAEHAGFYASRDPARYLAKCFAAKEAFAKAAGTGLRSPVQKAWGELHPTIAPWNIHGYKTQPSYAPSMPNT